MRVTFLWMACCCLSIEPIYAQVGLGSNGWMVQGPTFAPIATFPQTTTIEGLVEDEMGRPFESAEVFVLGQIKRTSSNADGYFSISDVNADFGAITVVAYTTSGSLVMRGVVTDLKPQPLEITDAGVITLETQSSSDEPFFSGLRPPTFSLGGRIASVLARDVNADGLHDLIATLPESGEVSVMLGNGDGSFQNERRYQAGASPSQFALEDMNRDQILDLIVNNAGESGISIILGNGDGTFREQQRFGVEYGAFSMALGDVNGDGNMDVVTANGYAADISVLLSNGDGTLKPQQRFPGGLIILEEIALGDYNADGNLDVFCGSSYQGLKVSIILGNGDGTFQAPMVERQSRALALVNRDVNTDGIPDVLIAAIHYPPSDIPSTPFLYDLGSWWLSNADEIPDTLPRISPNISSPVAVADYNGDGLSDMLNGTHHMELSLALDGRGQSFSPPRSLAKDEFEADMADLNGDGLDDIVAAGSSNISIFTSAGNEILNQISDQIPFQIIPNTVVAADFNADGNLDNVVGYGGHRNGPYVSVQLGNGDGTFQRSNAGTHVGDNPVAVTDINRDGILDIIASMNCCQHERIFISLGNGDGTFRSAPTIRVDEASLGAYGDFNNDGVLETLAGEVGGDLYTIPVEFEGTKTTPSQTQQPLDVIQPTEAYAVVVVDLDNDGYLDTIARSNESESFARVYMGKGDGTFKAPQQIDIGTNRFYMMVVVDLNEDQFPDLITFNTFDESISVLLGNGDGTFQSYQQYPVGGFPRSVAIGDIDRNGTVDLVAPDGNSLLLMFGNGAGAFEEKQQLIIDEVFPKHVMLDDVNKDGFLDFIVNIGVVIFANSDGTYSVEQRLDLDKESISLELEDINKDGALDVITQHKSINSVSVALGNTNGAFQDLYQVDIGNPAESINFGDVDEDGALDLLVAKEDVREVSIFLGNGDGTFQNPQDIETHAESALVDLGDFDADGIPDLFIGSRNEPRGNSIQILRGNGDASFQDQYWTLNSVDKPSAMEILDIDEDGLIDIVVANEGSNDVTVACTDGSGSFIGVQRIPVGSSPNSLATGDVNEDGILDIVTTNKASADVSVLLGRGNGNFDNQQRFGTGSSPNSATLIDINMDSHLDIVTANEKSKDVAILLGNGDGTFQTQQRYRLIQRNGPLAMKLGDLDHDGAYDLFTVHGLYAISINLNLW